MTHIITSLYLRHNDCMDVLPVECINPGSTTKGGELINRPGLSGHHENLNHRKEKVVIRTTRVLAAGEVVNLRNNIKANYDFYK